MNKGAITRKPITEPLPHERDPRGLTFAQAHKYVVCSVEQDQSYTRRFSDEKCAVKALTALRERGVDAWMK